MYLGVTGVESIGLYPGPGSSLRFRASAKSPLRSLTQEIPAFFPFLRDSAHTKKAALAGGPSITRRTAFP